MINQMDDEEFFYFCQVFRGIPYIIKGLCRLYIKSEFFKYLLTIIIFIPWYIIVAIISIILLSFVEYKYIIEKMPDFYPIAIFFPIYMFNELKLRIDEHFIFI